MRLADVVAEYRYCAFCGVGLRPDQAYRPDEQAPWYHSRECYEFSRVYPDLRRRLAGETAGSAMTTMARSETEED